MKNALLLLLLFSFQFVWAQDADKILGKWQSDDGQVTMEVTKSGQKYVGKIIAATNESAKDTKNPDPKLRSRSIIGIEILSNLVYTNGLWKGEIYTPKRGVSANCEVRLLPNGTMEIKASKYGQTQKRIWKRL